MTVAEHRRMFRISKRQGIALAAVLFLGLVSFMTFVHPMAMSGQCTSGGRAVRAFSQAMSFTQTTSNHKHDTEPVYVDLNQVEATAHAKDNEEHVLILTPLKNAANYLPRYFELLDRMTYPKHLISIAFLVSDTNDETVELLEQQADAFMSRWKNRYHNVAIYQKDFNFELPEDRRHAFEMQPLRRSYMARSRNYLLTAALREEHAWVLWLDVDLVEYPPTILEDLMSVDVDVVVPNCLRETEDNSFWGYDKNNWQETERSLELQKDLDPVSVNDFLPPFFYLLVSLTTHISLFILVSTSLFRIMSYLKVCVYIGTTSYAIHQKQVCMLLTHDYPAFRLLRVSHSS